MELLINLSKDIDGKEYDVIQPSLNQETSKIQTILQKMGNNINISNNNNNLNSNSEDEEQTIENNNDNNDYNDIDGEPL